MLVEGVPSKHRDVEHVGAGGVGAGDVEDAHGQVPVLGVEQRPHVDAGHVPPVGAGERPRPRGVDETGQPRDHAEGLEQMPDGRRQRNVLGGRVDEAGQLGDAESARPRKYATSGAFGWPDV